LCDRTRTKKHRAEDGNPFTIFQVFPLLERATLHRPVHPDGLILAELGRGVAGKTSHGRYKGIGSAISLTKEQAPDCTAVGDSTVTRSGRVDVVPSEHVRLRLCNAGALAVTEPNRLLMSQGDQRIDSCRPPRRNVACQHGNRS
jgi:hypothetical protein